MSTQSGSLDASRSAVSAQPGRWEKIGYGMGGAANNVIWTGISTFLVFFYTDVAGIAAGVIGTVMFFSRILDGVSDVVMGVVLDKTRFNVEHQGYTWEVDVYEGVYNGLVVAEVELQSETERPPIPDWIGDDVTGDRRYSNAVMANQDLSRELLDGLPPATR